MTNAPWEPGEVLDGRYELIKLVGAGGMGVVWRVFDREWGRDLALKLPRPAVLHSPILRERFVREAETWIGLGVHPHIVQCWFVTEVHGVPSLFLDYLTGGSLKLWIDEGHVRPGQWDLIIEIAMQAAEGLAYAHSKGVIHRDVKPENLLIRGDERLCVTDFGIVKTASEGEAASRKCETGGDAGVTGTGAFLGTPMYGAPEQWGQAESVGPQADLYALGVTLYEMCCGRRPFDTKNEKVPPKVLVARHLEEEPPDPREFYPDIPPDLAKLCLLMLEKNPAKRPPDMPTLREFLSAIHQQLTGRIFRAPAPMIGAQSPDVLNNQAVSLSKLGKLTQAVETLRRGLRLDPGHPDCLYNLVQLEKRHGRIGHMEAMRRLKQARAYYPLALLSIEEGMPNDAFDLLKGLNPDDLPSPGLVHRATGDALMYLGDFPGAERSYAHAHELMPKDAMAEHRKTLAAERGKDRAGAIYFPSPDPYQIDRSGDRSLRLLLDHGAEGLVGLTQGAAVYLTLSGGEPLVVERSANCGPATRTWIHGQHLAVADSQGFEFRQVPSMRLLTRRAGRILACSPQLDRVVTLEQAGPHLVLVEKGQFLPIKMEGQRPDQGPLLAVFDSSGKHLRLLLPSGQLAALDEENRAVVQSWPPHIEGHKEAKCMALTGDGALLLGFANGTVQGFSLKHQKMEFTSRLPDPPRTIEVHAGGSRIVVRTMRGFLILSRSGDLILSGDGPLAIDPQGRRALFFFKGRQVMYNLNPLHVLRRWSRVMEHPKSVAFSGDGRMAVALSADGEYLVWEMDEPHRVYQRELLMSPGRSYAEILSADEQFQRHLDLARQALGRGEQQESHRHLQRARRVPGYGQGAAALNFNWQLLESLKRDQLEAVWERLSIEGANPGDLDLAPEGRQLLFSFGNKACLSEEDEGGNRPIWTLTRRGQVRLLRFVQIAPDRKEILIADESGEVGLHDPADGRLKQTIKLEGGPLAHVMLHGISLTYLCKAGGLGTFELDDGSNSFRDDLKINVRVFGHWQRDKILVATSGNFGVLDLKRPGSKLQVLRLGMEFTKVPNFIEHLAERDLLVLGFSSGTLRVLDVAGGRVLCALKHGEGTRVTAFELLPELGVALTTTAKGQMQFWDLRNEELLDKFVAHGNGITGLRSSHGGRYLLTAGNDGIVRYWETSWTAGDVRGADNEVSWLSKGKRKDRFSKLLGRGGSSIG